MTGFDQTDLDAQFADYPGGPPALLDAASAAHPRLPVAWHDVVSAPEPAARRSAALAVWPPEFLARLPRFSDALATRLLDVRAIAVPDEADPWLLYVVDGGEGPALLWTGWSPASFGDREPPFFEAVPAPARTFLREVHAGFALDDGESFGLDRPGEMTTIADWAECPDGIPDWEGNWWEDCEPIDSRRLLRVTGAPYDTDLLVSPDLESGKAITNYSGHLQVVDFFDALDQIMCLPLEVGE